MMLLLGMNITLVCWAVGMEFPKQTFNHFTIEGSILNFSDSVILEVVKENGNLLIPLHKAKIGESFSINVPYEFSSETDLPLHLRIMISPYKALWENRMRDIWVMPGTKINAIFRNGETYSAELTSDIEEQIEQQKYDLAFLPIQEVAFLCNQKNIEYNLLWNKHLEETSYRDSSKMYEEQYRKALMEEPGCAVPILKENKHNKVWQVNMQRLAMMAYYYPEASYVEETKNMLQHLSPEEKEQNWVKEAIKLLFSKETYELGDLMDGSLVDREGKQYKLSDFRGKYILLDFWSVGCLPCRMSEKELQEISEIWANKLSVISINTDSLENWSDYSDKSSITWFNFQDEEGTSGLFHQNQCKALPTFVLLDPQGRKVHQFQGYEKDKIKAELSSLLH